MENKPQLTVADFVENAPAELGLRVLAGRKSLPERLIVSEKLQKPGLALAGFAHYIHQGRIQIIGRNEISYLAQLDRKQRGELLGELEFDKICCILVTKNLEIPLELLKICGEKNIPVLQTPLVTTRAINLTTAFLQEKLAAKTVIHGVLLEIHGIGVLIVGASGIGKSECALDLITRGHRLISDDAVIIKKIGVRLDGESPELTFEHLEIRGLGIVNVRDLFGVSAVSRRQPIQLCIEFKKRDKSEEIERLGLEMREHEILNVKLPKFVLPVSSGRNLSTLVETAVRLHLLKRDGYDAARQLIEKHSAMIAAN